MSIGPQKILDGYRRVQIRWGDTLQRLAARELGDATLWSTIVSINRLEPPYITGDPEKTGLGVLLYGDTIIIPGVGQEPSPGKTTAEDVFLRDVALPAGSLQVQSGDFAVVAGRDNLRQALTHRIQTEMGELLFHQGYGCRVHEQKGRKSAAVAGLLSALFVREAVLRDPRISSIDASRAGVDGDVILVEVEAQTISGHPVDVKTQV